MIMPANERQIAAAFVCSDPIDWGRDLQVLCDVLRSGGYLGKMDSQVPQPPFVFCARQLRVPNQVPSSQVRHGHLPHHSPEPVTEADAPSANMHFLQEAQTHSVPPGSKLAPERCENDVFPA